MAKSQPARWGRGLRDKACLSQHIVFSNHLRHAYKIGNSRVGVAGENFSHEETKLSCDFSRASVLFSIHKNLSSYEDSTFMIISNSGPSCNLVYGNTIHSHNPRESPRIGDSPYETAIET